MEVPCGRRESNILFLELKGKKEDKAYVANVNN